VGGASDSSPFEPCTAAAAVLRVARPRGPVAIDGVLEHPGYLAEEREGSEYAPK